jgi:hypothetical protein
LDPAVHGVIAPPRLRIARVLHAVGLFNEEGRKWLI